MIYQEGHGHKQVSIKERACEIIQAYRDHLEPMESIAKRLNCTRQAIWKVLKRNGIDTTKAQRVKRTCPVCGNEVLRQRGKARSTKGSYCNIDCYITYLETLGEAYRPSAWHCRAARKIVAQYHTLAPGEVVHHINKDDTDNRLHNLAVYANQSDHLREHRGQKIIPVWEGKNI